MHHCSLEEEFDEKTANCYNVIHEPRFQAGERHRRTCKKKDFFVWAQTSGKSYLAAYSGVLIGSSVSAMENYLDTTTNFSMIGLLEAKLWLFLFGHRKFFKKKIKKNRSKFSLKIIWKLKILIEKNKNFNFHMIFKEHFDRNFWIFLKIFLWPN